MELATRARDSGGLRVVASLCRSEGLPRHARHADHRTFLACASTSVRTERHVPGEGGSRFGGCVIALGDRFGVDRGVATRAFRQAFFVRGCCKQGRLRAVYSNLSALLRGFGTNESRSLAVIWFYATRLETRTKESDMCASLRVTETLGRNESKGKSDLPR